jgi:hypothetical protein
VKNAILLALAAVALGGCLDSIVGGRCADGFVADGESCRPVAGDDGDDDGVDAGGPLATDAGTTPDAPGTCGVCPSGICHDGICVGEATGHVVLVGHDYRVAQDPAVRLLGNAAALGTHPDLRIAMLDDGADDASIVAVRRALTRGLAATGRTWSQVASSTIADGDAAAADVVLILPRRSSADASVVAGDSWRPALVAFVTGGGTVIGLEGPDTTTTDFLRGATLLDATRGDIATGDEVTIVTPTDALAVGVISPYLAARASTTFATTGDAVVVATSNDAPIALHLAGLR